MCGFSGVLSPKQSEFDEAKLTRMLDAIEHRGPDDSGVWTNGVVFLGHRRLSIHDLSTSGHQPMKSHSSRFIIAFNGEIYNFEEIRAELPNVDWRGTSDTEVMLHAIDTWGVEKALQKFNGMFAFALWDDVEKKLTLARDRFGEKPLYYGFVNGCFVFSSELTSIEAAFGEKLSINRAALEAQATYSYIHAPLTIYNETSKLKPGCFLTCHEGKVEGPFPYWSIEETIETSKRNVITDEYEAVSLLNDELKKAVKLRMAADVPLGAFLSGGVDSSTVVALMQEQSTKPINTFSIGFNVPGYNEAAFAKEVAQHLRTNHHERYFSREDVLNIVPGIAEVFDEPFSDASQLPTLLVSKMAKEKVTVALSGDGGDELFSGYKRYTATVELWRKLEKIPARKALSKIIKSMPTSLLNVLFFFLESKAASYGRKGSIGPKMKNLAQWLAEENVIDFYKASISHWKPNDSLFQNVAFKEKNELYANGQIDNLCVGEMMMYLDTINYLPGDILTKVDRTAMNVSLEGRIPFLDHNVAELAWRMPFAMKQKGDIGKWPLKEVMYRYLPRGLMDRPKMGFGVPIHEWLRDELKEWSQDLLSFERLKRQGIYNPVVVNDTLTKHVNGSENNAAKLWDLLMVQAWFDAEPSRELRIK